ncbi:putative lipoprotein [Enterovirga rhinocerotis]|uniref:Putative lipoprotein n=2 Tax=Enterovirga rhinocerotis TaxID=1339210 RepID=A0A4R7BW63_9HYPH|nr:putative lipoprotein [Enterovirga rhinocerotis]
MTRRGHAHKLAILAAMACLWPLTEAAEAGTRFLDGRVIYRERMALPPSALVEVSLLDVSRADARAVTLGRTTIRPGRQAPIRYRLGYDDARILPGRSYALHARITAGGRLLFLSTDRHPVFAGGPNATDILVRRVGGEPQAASPAGRWRAERIGGRGVVDRLQSVLDLATDGAVSGTGGCNRMSGRASVNGAAIVFGPLASTEMACPPAAMDQERRFFEALRRARAWTLDQTRAKLVLRDARGRSLLLLSRM